MPPAPLPTIEPRIAQLTPYRPGKPIEEVKRELGIADVVKMASNENPLGPSPRALAAAAEALGSVHLYPDAACHALRERVSQLLQISPDMLVFGNGSDEVIHYLGVAFLSEGDNIVQGDPSFVRYEAAAVLNRSACRKVALTQWVHDLDAMADAVDDRTRIVFIANPNNPTGTLVSRLEVERFLDAVPETCITVFDEAYHEYVDDPDAPDLLPHIREGRNVVVLRTFSKAYGLAGMRIGYGVCRPEIADALNRVREPFNVSLPGQAAALAALDDHEHLEMTLRINRQGRDQLAAGFTRLGLEATPTQGNFLWVNLRRDGRQVYDALLKQGVIVRTGDVFGAHEFLRITIGTPEQNARLLSALEGSLQQ
jgi:histidinol-phosphate aminotransferase